MEAKSFVINASLLVARLQSLPIRSLLALCDATTTPSSGKFHFWFQTKYLFFFLLLFLEHDSSQVGGPVGVLCILFFVYTSVLALHQSSWIYVWLTSDTSRYIVIKSVFWMQCWDLTRLFLRSVKLWFIKAQFSGLQNVLLAIVKWLYISEVKHNIASSTLTFSKLVSISCKCGFLPSWAVYTDFYSSSDVDFFSINHNYCYCSSSWFPILIQALEMNMTLLLYKHN